MRAGVERLRADVAVPDLAGWRRRATPAEITAQVGMLVFLAAWTMLFAGLFLAYGLLRSRSAAWPPPDLPALPRLVPGLATLLLVASDVAAERALGACAGRAGAAAGRRLAIAAALGGAFLALQLAVWSSLWQAGLRPTGGPYPSVFYGLTVFHALHVAVGLGALGWLAAGALRRGTSRLAVRLWGTYWHFVALVWLAMYVALYLE